MRGRTIASFGQAFVCLVDSGSHMAKAAMDTGAGVDEIALSATLAISDSASGAESVMTFYPGKYRRGALSLQPRSFTIKADMQ